MLVAQAIGSAIITASTFGVALAVMYAVNAFGILRVTAEGETLGLDLHEHGISAYPEYVISSTSVPCQHDCYADWQIGGRLEGAGSDRTGPLAPLQSAHWREYLMFSPVGRAPNHFSSRQALRYFSVFGFASFQRGA